ncbi:MAG: hypothetical protein K1X67_00065 [Fimbriimonadaceae bacterium]|nr:hypothetical protein [Fimbriimonadaceae bacterium]
MPTPAKILMALGALILVSCSGFVGFLFVNEARYQQERQMLLTAASTAEGMNAPDAERTLRAMKEFTDCEIIRSADAIVVISRHQYGFIGTFGVPAVELKFDSKGVVTDVRLIERGGGL